MQGMQRGAADLHAGDRISTEPLHPHIQWLPLLRHCEWWEGNAGRHHSSAVAVEYEHRRRSYGFFDRLDAAGPLLVCEACGIREELERHRILDRSLSG
jgi:hypothetical protein